MSDEDLELVAKDARMTPAQRAKRDEQRALVISEIQSTERSYVQALDALHDAFVVPLRQKQKSDKPFDMSPAQVAALCSNLETLVNFHHTFLDSLSQVAASKPAAAGATAAPSIPAIFMRFSEFFRLYIPYLNGYEQSLNTLNKLRKNSKFSDWLNGDVKNGLQAHATRNGGGAALDLLSYMIQPVQRVPRYVLLLKELKRQTSPSHPEFASLGDALAAVQRVASVINEGQRAIENMSKLMTVQQRIIGDFETLIQPHRRLIREGPVTVTKSSSGVFNSTKVSRRVFFLFSDILLWTSDEYKFKGTLDLTPVKLVHKSATAFSLDSPHSAAQKALEVSCDTEAEAASWFDSIQTVVKALQEEREKRRDRTRQVHQRNLTSLHEHDTVHKLVTSSLQHLSTPSDSSPSSHNRASAGRVPPPVPPRSAATHGTKSTTADWILSQLSGWMLWLARICLGPWLLLHKRCCM